MPLAAPDVLGSAAGPVQPLPQVTQPAYQVPADLVRAIADAILSAVSQGFQQGVQHGILQGLVQQSVQAAPPVPQPVPGPVPALQELVSAPQPAPAQPRAGRPVSARSLFSWNPKVGTVQPASPVRQPSETYLARQALESILARIAGRRA